MSDDLSELDQWLASDDDDELTETPDATPADSGAVEASGTADAAPTAEGVGVDRGDGRDVHGKWVGKGTDPAQAPETATPGSDTAAPTATTETNATTPVTPEAPATEAAPAPAEPLVVKYRDQEFEIPGSVVTPEGVFIPKSQQEILSAYLGKGIKLEAERADLRTLEFQTKQALARSQATNAEVDRLLQIAALPDDQQFAEAMLAYGLELRDKLPLLQDRMKLEQEKAQFELQRTLNAPDPDELAARAERDVQATIQGNLQEMFADPALQDFTDGDKAAVTRWVTQNGHLLRRTAGQHLTADERAAGIQPGETYVDWRAAAQYAADRLAIRREALEASQKAKAAVAETATVAQQNAAKLAKAASVAAPEPQKAPAKTGARRVVEDEDEMSSEALTRYFAGTLG